MAVGESNYCNLAFTNFPKILLRHSCTYLYWMNTFDIFYYSQITRNISCYVFYIIIICYNHIHIFQKQGPSQFWFATGGAGYCISRALAMKMAPFAA